MSTVLHSASGGFVSTRISSPARRNRRGAGRLIARSVLCIAEQLERRQLLSGGVDKLINNNTGGTATSDFTQSETTIVAFGNNIVAGFNDSGSNNGASKFTGWAFSSDGGTTWTDGGTLPTSGFGDAGDPTMARDNVTGRIYFGTLGFTQGNTLPVFRSDTNGASWLAPVNGAPGKTGTQDKEWITVDNAPGAGQGNVYLIERDFGGGNNIFFFKSTDQGATFGPNLGMAMNVGSQGAFICTGPNHEIYVFGFNGANILMKKSTDFGATFGGAVVVATFLAAGGTNGDLGLTGTRNGTATVNAFRSNKFPHATVNPISGNIYVTYNDDGAGVDKGDVYFVQSTNGGASFGAPVKVNDDVTTTDQWQPTLAVTPDGANLGVFYSSRQEDSPANNLFKYYGRLATISGATVTFSASSAISDVASLPEFGRDGVVNSVYMGDYNFVSASNSAFHVVWSDNRSDYVAGPPRKDPNVYYDRIDIGVPNGVWDGGGDAINWTDPVNWSNNVLPTAADDVIINIAANPNIVVNGAQSVKSVTSSENLAINGTLSVANPSTFGATVTVNTGGSLGGAGTIAISGSIVMTGGIISGSASFTINVGAAIQFSAVGITRINRPLTLNGTGAAFIGGNQLLVLTSLTFGAGASLNMTNNDMIINYSGATVLPQVQAFINSARNGGAWNGPGLTSTSAQLAGNTSLGAMEGTDFGGSFDGEPLDGTAIIIKYTYYGDANFNGQVDGGDYAKTDATFNQEVATQTNIGGWSNGDYNGDGKVDGADYSLMDAAFNSQGGVLRPVLPPVNNSPRMQRISGGLKRA